MANATIASSRATNQSHDDVTDSGLKVSQEITTPSQQRARTGTMGFRTGSRSARERRGVLCLLGFAINVKIITFIVHIIQVIRDSS